MSLLHPLSCSDTISSRLGDIMRIVACLARNAFRQWDLVFSISEGLYGAAREAQIPALCDAYRIPHVFSEAATLALCLDKGKTKVYHLHVLALCHLTMYAFKLFSSTTVSVPLPLPLHCL